MLYQNIAIEDSESVIFIMFVKKNAYPFFKIRKFSLSNALVVLIESTEDLAAVVEFKWIGVDS